MTALINQVAIVTGASSGIGAATAKTLAQRGVHVALAARRVERIEALATELTRTTGVRTLALQTDMTRQDDIERMVQATMARFGRVDILVNNAGLGLQGDITQLGAEPLRYLFDVNVFGALFAMQAVAPLMARQGGGVIVNVSSILGKVVVPSLGMVGSSAGYTASKFALAAFSTAARMELAAQKIHVMTVLPGVTDTEFDESFLVSNIAEPGRKRKKGGLLGVTSAERVADRLVRGIEHREREVYITRRDRLVVLGATAMPRLWEWGMMRLRQWRMADRARWVRLGALVAGALALAIAVQIALMKRLVNR